MVVVGGVTRSWFVSSSVYTCVCVFVCVRVCVCVCVRERDVEQW